MRLIDADRLRECVGKLFPHKMPFDYDEIDNEIGALLCEVGEMIDKQPTLDDWIPCSERLPEFEVLRPEVLCCDKYKNIMIGYISEDEESSTGYSAENDAEMMDSVVAWMPLPVPYKGE